MLIITLNEKVNKARYEKIIVSELFSIWFDVHYSIFNGVLINVMLSKIEKVGNRLTFFCYIFVIP
jgi:hypothetical protein